MSAPIDEVAESPPQALPEVPGCTVAAVIGQGATGTVFRGRQISHARDVAIRVIDPACGRVPAVRRAAQQTAGLTHPNVVRVYEVSEHEGRSYVAMEHLAGGSLDEKVRAHGGRGLPWREAVRIVNLAAAGLAHVHEKGLVHGAVRPSSVLLRAEGHVKLGELGVPLAAGEDAAATTTAPHFLSPEQARNEPATSASDIYALGAALYYALTGLPPHNGNDADEILASIANEEPPALESVRSDLPRDVIDLVGSMTARDPSLRPADLGRIRQRLAATLNGAEAPKDVKPRNKRSGTRGGAIAVALVLLAGGAAWFALRGRSSDGASGATAGQAGGASQSEAARRAAEILARQRALGPVRKSNLEAYGQVADEYARLAAESSIDDPAVLDAWAHRRELALSLTTAKGEDPVSARLVDDWIAKIVDAAEVAPPDPAEGDAHDVPALVSSRESAQMVAEKLLDQGRCDEGLGTMAAWVATERALARRRKSDENERAEIQTGADWLRSTALAIATKLRVDLSVDAEILRTHLAETSCFGSRRGAARAPDFERSRARIAAISNLLVTAPARNRVNARRAAIDGEASAFQFVWTTAAAKPDGSSPDAWPSAVAKAIETSFDSVPSYRRAGALRLLVETGDVERVRALAARASSLNGDDAAEVRAECEALAEFAKARAPKDAAKRAEALARWVVQHAATDASFVLADCSECERCVAAHPGVPSADAERWLAAWGAEAQTSAKK